MLRILLTITIGVAPILMALVLVGRVRRSRPGRVRLPLDAVVAPPVATLIGVLPGLLGIANMGIRNAATLVSLLLSFAAAYRFRRTLKASALSSHS
jgi:hypothetical protein